MLAASGVERCPVPKAALNDGAKATFVELYRQSTNGARYGLDTEALLNRLQRWLQIYKAVQLWRD